jgi:glycosyltransferase involved in cell wall biosynthesis
MLVGMEASSDMALTRSWNTLLGQGVLRFVPRQPKDKIFRFLAMADVVVSPRASGSNIALKIFDYLAAGKPIVAADSPAHRALLNEERAVLIQNTPEELSRAIVRLLQDPNESRRLGESAKAYAQKYLSRSAFTSRVAELYNLEGLPALQNPKAVFDGRPI